MKHTHGVDTVTLNELDCAIIFRADGPEFITQTRSVFVQGLGAGGLAVSDQLRMALIAASMFHASNFDLWTILIERLAESDTIKLKELQPESGKQ